MTTSRRLAKSEPPRGDLVRALVVARCVDHGISADAARILIDEKVAARAAKADAA